MPTDHKIHPHLYDPSGVDFFAPTGLEMLDPFRVMTIHGGCRVLLAEPPCLFEKRWQTRPRRGQMIIAGTAHEMLDPEGGRILAETTSICRAFGASNISLLWSYNKCKIINLKTVNLIQARTDYQL